MTMQLVLLRHGESEYNKENKFCGWHDAELSAKGQEEAAAAGVALKEAGFDFDLCFTSYLKRAIHTLDLTLTSLDRCWLPVIKTWCLNERHYGALQGLNKSETAAKYGEDQVKIWRRSFATTPPALDPQDPRNPALQEQYRGVDAANLPLAESLKLTIDRTVPYYEQHILPEMLAGKRVIIAAHGNSLRALAMYLEGMSEQEILEFNIPTAVPLVYTLDDQGGFISKEYIGDPDVIAAKVNAVANQGKAK